MKPFDGAQRARSATPVVICLHASGGSGAQWRTLADMMRRDFDVWTPDLYGHGDAPLWCGASADIVGADAARIAALAANVGELHLVGHSYGGAVALRVALQRPDNVASVSVYEPVPMRILFDYNARDRAAAEVADVARTIRRELNGGSAARAAQRFIDYWSGTPLWRQLAPERQAAIVRCMPVIRDQFTSLARDPIQLADYRRLSAPVLQLSGRETRASARRIGELLRYALPHVDSVSLSAMGHLGPLTHAQAVARRIAQFVRRYSAPAVVSERRAA